MVEFRGMATIVAPMLVAFGSCRSLSALMSSLRHRAHLYLFRGDTHLESKCDQLNCYRRGARLGARIKARRQTRFSRHIQQIRQFINKRVRRQALA